MAKVLGLDHVSIIVADAEKSLQFYQQLLDLQVLDRPNLGFPGYWLDFLAGQSLHIMQLANPNENALRPEHGGRDFHFAIRVDNLQEYCQRLDAMPWPYTLSKSGRQALFIRDPDNNAVELTQWQAGL